MFIDLEPKPQIGLGFFVAYPIAFSLGKKGYFYTMQFNLKKTVLTLAIFSGMALLPMACDITDPLCNNSCGCDPIGPVKDFVVKSFETKNIQTNGNEVDPDVFYPFDQVLKTLSLGEVEFLATEILSEPSGITGVAFACSMMPPKSVNKLVNIRIFNMENVSLNEEEALVIGQDITSLFNIHYTQNQTLIPISDFLEDGLNIYSVDVYKLQFLEDPGQEIELHFSIQIQLEGGKEFNLQNEVLKIS